jgi:hypothetical protein
MEPHATNARASPTLLWIHGDTLRQLGHAPSPLLQNFF